MGDKMVDGDGAEQHGSEHDGAAQRKGYGDAPLRARIVPHLRTTWVTATMVRGGETGNMKGRKSEMRARAERRG